jgi:MbtH protein
MEPDDHLVLLNEENQYSIWLAGVAVPAGWREVHRGSEAACVSYVDEHWVDMRPASLARAGQG